MNTSFNITIPKPCHEDWNKMTPDQKGAFCGSCQKSVYDFTKKTDEEVGLILAANEGKKICGRFNSTQLNTPIDLNIPIYDLPKNISPLRAFAMAALLVFGTILFSCEGMEGQTVGKLKFIPKTEVTAKEENKVPVTNTNKKEFPPQVMGGPKYTPVTTSTQEDPKNTKKIGRAHV